MAVTARIDELRRKYEQNPRRYFAPLANEYRKAGELDAAIAICRHELADYPEHISGHIVLGQALYEAGRRGEARGVFETALGLDPENLIALRHLGDIARAEGDDVGARHWYGRILEADPRNDDIAALLATVSGERHAPPAAAAGPGAAAPVPRADDGFVGGWDIPAFAAPADGAGGAPSADAPIPVVSGPITAPPHAPVLPHLAPGEDEYLDDLVDAFAPPGGAAAPAAEPAAGGVSAEQGATAEAATAEGADAGTLAAESSASEAPAFEEVELDAPGFEPPGAGSPLAEEGAPATRAAREGPDVTPEIPDWLEATPRLAEHSSLPDDALEPVVGLDIAPVRDSAQEQLGAAELDGAELPAAELWAAELAAAEPALDEARSAAAERVAEEEELAPWEEPPELGRPEDADEAVDVLDLEGALIEAAPPGEADAADEVVGAVEASAAPEADPAREGAEGAPPTAATSHDDAHVDATELSALTSGAFATETLAELFVQQGHLDQAVAIYERLASERPDEPALHSRLRAVRRMAAGEPAEDEPQPVHEAVAEAAAEAVPDATAEPAAEAVAEQVPQADAMPAHPAASAPLAREYFAALAARAVSFGHPVDQLRPTPASAERAVEPTRRHAPGSRHEPRREPPPEPRAEPVAGPVAEPGGASLLEAPASESDERAAQLLARAYGDAEGADTSLLGDLAAIEPPPPPAPAPATPAAEPASDDLSFDRFFAGFEDLLDARPPTGAPSPLEEPLVAAPEPAAEPPTGAPVATDPPERPKDSGDEDLAQFNAWLKGLGDL